MLEADTAAVPDLLFNAELIVTHDDVVACRLGFECTPPDLASAEALRTVIHS
jgi:predicted ester cyclase